MKSLNAWHAKALAMRINNEINQIQPPIDLILIKYLFIDEAWDLDRTSPSKLVEGSLDALQVGCLYICKDIEFRRSIRLVSVTIPFFLTPHVW